MLVWIMVYGVSMSPYGNRSLMKCFDDNDGPSLNG